MEPRYNTPLSVLVVEPHADGADSLAELLRLVGHRVAVAHTGATALRAADEPPDVIILELRLPDLDGWEVVRRLREPAEWQGKCPFLVALTTCGSVDDRRRSAEARIDLHLVKAAEPSVLIGVLARFAQVLAPGTPDGDGCRSCRANADLTRPVN
jgi:CheY-like chemotaxis protein